VRQGKNRIALPVRSHARAHARTRNYPAVTAVELTVIVAVGMDRVVAVGRAIGLISEVSVAA
jgi:hypothetical protein